MRARATRHTGDGAVKKNRPSIVLCIAAAAFLVYMVAAICNQQAQIRDQRAKLANLQKQIQVQEIKNQDIRHELADSGQSDAYIERMARESLNMAKSGERIFVCPGGD